MWPVPRHRADISTVPNGPQRQGDAVAAAVAPRALPRRNIMCRRVLPKGGVWPAILNSLVCRQLPHPGLTTPGPGLCYSQPQGPKPLVTHLRLGRRPP